MAFSDPEKNIAQFMLGEGMSVADLGAGSGAYTIAAARAVGKEGRVFAIDVQKDLIEKIRNHARTVGLMNVEISWGDMEAWGGTKLLDASLDAVIVTNVLFQADDKRALVQEAKRILKPRGKALVVDWRASFGNLGPRESDIVPEAVARELFENEGFTIEKTIAAGEHHYGFVARL